MILLRSADPTVTDAIQLFSGIGDLLSGHALGFSMRVARVAANFAVHRGCDAETVAATYFAGALHAVGHVRISTQGLPEREAAIVRWDAPPQGARIVAAIPGLPPATSDYVRWHREAFDGTGFPDRLRWDATPPAAIALNAARAFVTELDANGTGAEPGEALFALVTEAGRTFSLDVVHEFHAFLAVAATSFDAPFVPVWQMDDGDPHALVRRICAEIDARDERTYGRGARIESIVRASAPALDDIDVEEAAFAAHLTALGKLHDALPGDDYDPLSRLGREARAADAATAAHILAWSPAFAAFAPILGASAEWFDGTGLPARKRADHIPPIARLLSVALAANALEGSPYARTSNGYPEPSMRISAAAGTQFDPSTVTAYLASIGSTS